MLSIQERVRTLLIRKGLRLTGALDGLFDNMGEYVEFVSDPVNSWKGDEIPAIASTVLGLLGAIKSLGLSISKRKLSSKPGDASEQLIKVSMLK